MSIRKHPTREGWWQIRYYPDGRQGKESCDVIEGTRADALAHEAYIRQRQRQKPIDAFPAVSELLPEYIQHYRRTSLDSAPMLRYLARWRRYVGTLRCTAIDARLIDRYKDDRLAEGIAPTTINKELSALSKFLKWAAKKRYCTKPDFIERFPAKMCRAPLPDVPTRAEVLALINAAIWPHCGLIACLYYGGMRRGEAMMLKAEDVYLERSVMIVRGKGNKQRVIPIVPDLEPWLEKRLGEVPAGILWTTSTGRPIADVKTVIRNAAVRAGITRRIYPHLLRHAFGTHATMGGVPLRHLQNIMGHESSRTTEIYTTLADSAIIDELRTKF